MLTSLELKKIRERLEFAQNPLFFFDNDVDGLCSFLILQRALERGKGVAIKSFPELDRSYARKVRELNPDVVFILDKPRISEEFVNEVLELNVPIIWIDHHDVQVSENILKKVEYYNSAPESEPVTAIAYEIFKNKKDRWIAMIGCIGDVYMPSFAREFGRENPELFDYKINAFDALYLTRIGEAIKLLNFGLKDSTTNVVRLMKLMMKANSIYDIFEENSRTRHLHKKAKFLNSIYNKLMDKAECQIDEKADLLFFVYGGEVSMSSEVSNGLLFNHPKKLIIVAYKRPDKINLSVRGEKAREVLVDVLEGIEGASGGGHEKACGAVIPSEYWEKFKEKFKAIARGKR